MGALRCDVCGAKGKNVRSLRITVAALGKRSRKPLGHPVFTREPELCPEHLTLIERLIRQGTTKPA